MKGGGTMRHFIAIVCFILTVFILGLTTQTTQSQPYPNHPIQLIIPNVAGSQGDITGRLLANDLGKILGIQIVVINKPGASLTLGTDAVVRSKKDGYTLAYTAASGLVYARVTNPETVPYDPPKDLEPLGLHVFFTMAVAVQESSPWKTFSELIDYAKKNPGKLRVSTIGVGSIDHFNLEMVQSLTGAQFTHIPFKGGESVVTALLGGHVEVTHDTFSKIIPHVSSGKLRILLLAKKMPEFPTIPTLTELGYKQDLLSTWYGMFAPAGIPEEVKNVLTPAIEKAINDPESKAKLEKMGFTVDYKSPAGLKKLMIDDYETAYSIAVKIGLRK
jgi:tripartite-type tricarboxylate transporter receptor subunit TctC